MEGWIKLHRAIQGNDLWTSELFSRGQAWVDLLLSANHKESFFYKRGNKVIVKRGQVGRSEVELSDRWKWSRTKVRKFLKDLEKEQQIKIFKSRITQVLTIVNYNLYQEKEQQTGQQKDSRRTTEEQQKDIYKNEEKEKKEKNEEKREREKAHTQEILELNSTIEKLQLSLKTKEAKEKKVAPKKRKKSFEVSDCDFPPEFEQHVELKAAFLKFAEMRKQKGKPYKTKSGTETKINTLAKDVGRFGLENVIGAIVHSTGMEYQGIFVKDYTDKINKQKKDEQKQSASNGKSIYENYAESIGLNLNEGPNGTTDADWSEA